MTLPTDKTERKQYPIYSGLLMYFPRACAAVAHCSWVGNEQHNPGEPLHWAREKSGDHHDCIVRHLMEAGAVDKDGVRHIVKVAWRALAAAELELEAAADPNPDGKPVAYIAGKMRGVEQFNFPAFDTAAQVWADAGYHVISPADLDRERGFDGTTEPTPEFLQTAMREDLLAVADADVLAVLPGWENSEGAGIEVRYALMMGKPIHDARTQDRIPDAEARAMLNGETEAAS
jgi:hypothetical protein